MNYGYKKLFLPLILLVLGFIIFSFSVLAQTPQNYDVTVSPVFFDLSANPGQTITEKIRIRNNTSSPLPLKISVKRLAGDEVGDLTLNEENSDQSLDWINFSNKSFIAPSLEWSDVSFTIQVPNTAAYGYYFAVTFEHDIASTVTQGASLTGASAVPILLNVRKEGAKIAGKLAEFKTDSSFYEYPPVKFIINFQNSGNVHVRPFGNIFITDWLGRQVGVLNVNDTQGAILPNTRKIFENAWNDSFITRELKIEDGQVVLDKDGKPKTTLKIRFDKILDLRIGRYSASALLVLNTGNRDIPFQAETSFFVFPWMLVIGIILFVIFAGVGFFNTIRNFVRRIFRIFRKS